MTLELLKHQISAIEIRLTAQIAVLDRAVNEPVHSVNNQEKLCQRRTIPENRA